MYVTAEELYKEGAQGSRVRIDEAIALAQKYIEDETGWWFEQREKTMSFDGSECKGALFLPVFPYEILEVKSDGALLAETDDYVLYNRFYPDDRWTSKITFEFAVVDEPKIITVKAKWGFVEEDGPTPILIKKICKKLALTEIPTLTTSGRRDDIDRGKIIEERTDGHQYRLSEKAVSGGPTGDAEIDGVISAYSKPAGVAVV
jgi:hypothetical protein